MHEKKETKCHVCPQNYIWKLSIVDSNDNHTRECDFEQSREIKTHCGLKWQAYTKGPGTGNVGTEGH